ncbi:28S ribosomal protein S9, mitochondrial-like [Photinus pyralis]|uniref:28S ribosomal protein S9, mitochondrial-like n=1 Tax=Photinus pyralis TaxID=7054 RepID=UPI001266E68F|nr:28S ribosomal protein S9, mitochondrial-like [Photinus pyralis]
MLSQQFSKYHLLITPLKNRFKEYLSKSLCSSVVPDAPSGSIQPQKKNVSKAMKAYLQRAEEHEAFMNQERHEFQLGKRHLANMMGENPDTFTQEDINNAIEYLFPSGLYDKTARPIMKPPEDIFPQRKAAEFNEMGRPHHYLFYTGNPNYYKMLYDAVEYMNSLIKFEDTMIRKNLKPDENLALELSGFQLLEKQELENKLMEEISDKQYEAFAITMERLCHFPYSYRFKDFILSYRKLLMRQSESHEIPKLQYDKDGRAYITTYECLRKRARGHVTLRSPGVGEVSVNGQDLNYFKDRQSREQELIVIMLLSSFNQEYFYQLQFKFTVTQNCIGRQQMSMSKKIIFAQSTALTRSFF